jgi:hypothetical protein
VSDTLNENAPGLTCVIVLHRALLQNVAPKKGATMDWPAFMFFMIKVGALVSIIAAAWTLTRY